jgi:hypothetical protein
MESSFKTVNPNSHQLQILTPSLILTHGFKVKDSFIFLQKLSPRSYYVAVADTYVHHVGFLHTYPETNYQFLTYFYLFLGPPWGKKTHLDISNTDPRGLAKAKTDFCCGKTSRISAATFLTGFLSSGWSKKELKNICRTIWKWAGWICCKKLFTLSEAQTVI